MAKKTNDEGNVTKTSNAGWKADSFPTWPASDSTQGVGKSALELFLWMEHPSEADGELRRVFIAREKPGVRSQALPNLEKAAFWTFEKNLEDQLVKMEKVMKENWADGTLNSFERQRAIYINRGLRRLSHKLHSKNEGSTLESPTRFGDLNMEPWLKALLAAESNGGSEADYVAIMPARKKEEKEEKEREEEEEENGEKRSKLLIPAELAPALAHLADALGSDSDTCMARLISLIEVENGKGSDIWRQASLLQKELKEERRSLTNAKTAFKDLRLEWPEPIVNMAVVTRSQTLEDSGPRSASSAVEKGAGQSGVHSKPFKRSSPIASDVAQNKTKRRKMSSDFAVETRTPTESTDMDAIALAIENEECTAEAAAELEKYLAPKPGSVTAMPESISYEEFHSMGKKYFVGDGAVDYLKFLEETKDFSLPEFFDTRARLTTQNKVSREIRNIQKYVTMLEKLVASEPGYGWERWLNVMQNTLHEAGKFKQT